MDQSTVTPVAGAPAPGWYADPSGRQRWWDGAAWTSHVVEAAPVAAAVPVTPVYPAVDPVAAAAASAPAAPPAPTASTTLLPGPVAGAPSGGGGGGHRLRALSGLPRWVPVVAVVAVLALAAGAFFLLRGGDDSASSDGSTTTAGGSDATVVLTKAQLTAALPAAAALPKVGNAAWASSAPDTATSELFSSPGTKVLPARCSAALNAIAHVAAKPTATVTRGFVLPKLAALMAVEAASYPTPVPAVAIQSAFTLAKSCPTVTTTEGGSTSTLRVVSATALNGGTGVHLRLSTTAGGRTVPVDMVLVRVGHTLVGAESFGAGASAATEAAVLATVAHLPH